MAAKKRNAKRSKSAPVAPSVSTLRSTMIGTILNMIFTCATAGAALLRLVVARHFT